MEGLSFKKEGVCQSAGQGQVLGIAGGDGAEVLHAQERSHAGANNEVDSSIV